jgi:hypothetical protein
MKKVILLILILMTATCCQRKCKNLKNNTIMDRSYETYDFETAKEYNTDYNLDGIKIGDTIRFISPINENGGDYVDYPPASDFYYIPRIFYPNGVIKSKAKYFGKVRFDTFEEFDENGYCIKRVDENKKFGEIKREYIIHLLEEEGWFNRKTGENKVTEVSPLKTDGTFYRDIIKYIVIGFIEAKCDKSGKEIAPPEWIVDVRPGLNVYVTLYVINGHTGKYKKSEYALQIVD